MLSDFQNYFLSETVLYEGYFLLYDLNSIFFSQQNRLFKFAKQKFLHRKLTYLHVFIYNSKKKKNTNKKKNNQKTSKAASLRI